VFDMVRTLSGTDPAAVYCDEFSTPQSWYKSSVCVICVICFAAIGQWIPIGTLLSLGLLVTCLQGTAANYFLGM
jgi:hypothetical protein